MDQEIKRLFVVIEQKLNTLLVTQSIKSCLTKKEVAQRLNVSVRKLQYMIAEGEIVGFYVGNEWRMKPENLERWIDKKHVHY